MKAQKQGSLTDEEVSKSETPGRQGRPKGGKASCQKRSVGAKTSW